MNASRGNRMENYPQRKQNRLRTIRYDGNGAYFITICTKDRASLFWAAGAAVPPVSANLAVGAATLAVGAAMRRPPEGLAPLGRIVWERIAGIDAVYGGVISVDNYVVMPNHVHLLMSIHPGNAGGRRIGAPTISTVVNQLKGAVSKTAGFSCWQKSFHDHVVRDDRDYRDIWQYIDANPGRWTEDRYYTGVDG